MVWKDWFWKFFTLGGYFGLEWFSTMVESSGSCERTDFAQLCFGMVWWPWKDWIWTISHVEGCGGLERTDLKNISTLGRCDGLERNKWLINFAKSLPITANCCLCMFVCMSPDCHTGFCLRNGVLWCVCACFHCSLPLLVCIQQACINIWSVAKSANSVGLQHQQCWCHCHLCTTIVVTWLMPVRHCSPFDAHLVIGHVAYICHQRDVFVAGTFMAAAW